MFYLAMSIPGVLLFAVIYEVYIEYKREKQKEKQAKELFIIPARKEVIQGIFRQHNEQFKKNGVKYNA